jgi:ubiquinone/menaquinone biosynthesis C-methylase UbiE
MRLNIGCGGRRIAGYTGVDAIERPAADIVAPANAIPLPDASVDEILAVHLWEHFYRWECDDVIAEWSRLLKPGGTLVLELPDLIKCCENILRNRMVGGKDPDQLSYWGIFGDPRPHDPYMTHRWGWTPTTLREYLSTHGFRDIDQQPPQWHPAGRDHRDMRFVAVKA